MENVNVGEIWCRRFGNYIDYYVITHVFEKFVWFSVLDTNLKLTGGLGTMTESGFKYSYINEYNIKKIIK